MDATVACVLCGRHPEDEADALGWAVDVRDGVVSRLCPACARTHVRSLESKLDPEYWS